MTTETTTATIIPVSDREQERIDRRIRRARADRAIQARRQDRRLYMARCREPLTYRMVG